MSMCLLQGGGLGEERVAEYEKQLKEKEDRENKFKQLALKAKKESGEIKTKVSYSM